MFKSFKSSLFFGSMLLVSINSVFAEDVVKIDKNGVKINAAPVVVCEQKSPIFAVGKSANEQRLLGVSLKDGIGVTIPFVTLRLPLWKSQVGPDKANVTVDNGASVTAGPVTVGQKLPLLDVGTNVNTKELKLDVGFKGGLSVNTPLVSLNVPYPSLKNENNK
tara:strand:+ start:8 stop:496 length:489 start_codon:yes stop_codon:yes gene_type:complete